MNTDGTADRNGESFFETSNGQRPSRDLMDGTGDTAAAKVTSHCTDFVLTAKRIISGSENLVDVNNETDRVTVVFERGEINGAKYGVSAKTSQRTTFQGTMAGAPRSWHVNLGSYSDQSMKPQTDTRLNLSADALPIKVWSGNARRTVCDDPSKYQFVFKVWLCDVPYVGAVTCWLFIRGWWLAKKILPQGTQIRLGL